MRKFNVFNLCVLALVVVISSCSKELETEILEQKIESNHKDVSIEFPFSDKAELKSMAVKKVVDFELVRKITFLELRETGLMSDMNWTGCKLSKLPITIYDLNSKPRFYDFIVYDAEKKAIGTVRTYAKRENSTVIEGAYSKVFDYNTLLTKSSSSSPSIFMDWKGAKYVGVKSKAGEKPKEIISLEGQAIPSSEVKELEGKEIVDFMSDNVLPDLVISQENKDKIFSNVPKSLLDNKEIKDEIDYLDQTPISVDVMRDSMMVALERTQKEAQAYWNTLSEHEKELLEASDEEIASESKFFGRLFRRIFSRVDRSRHPIPKYEGFKDKEYKRSGGEWCGPWVCGYILYVNQGIDKFKYFEDWCSTIGAAGFGFLLSKTVLKGEKAMYPSEMSASMPIASGGKIWINPVPLFQDLCAYDQIKHYRRPAIRLCWVSDSSGSGFHWVLAYGARQTGSWFWRNYYFLQTDNGAYIKKIGNGRNNDAYKSVEWWNPWLMVWD